MTLFRWQSSCFLDFLAKQFASFVQQVIGLVEMIFHHQLFILMNPSQFAIAKWSTLNYAMTMVYTMHAAWLSGPANPLHSKYNRQKATKKKLKSSSLCLHSRFSSTQPSCDLMLHLLH